MRSARAGIRRASSAKAVASRTSTAALCWGGVGHRLEAMAASSRCARGSRYKQDPKFAEVQCGSAPKRILCSKCANAKVCHFGESGGTAGGRYVAALAPEGARACARDTARLCVFHRRVGIVRWTRQNDQRCLSDATPRPDSPRWVPPPRVKVVRTCTPTHVCAQCAELTRLRGDHNPTSVCEFCCVVVKSCSCLRWVTRCLISLLPIGGNSHYGMAKPKRCAQCNQAMENERYRSAERADRCDELALAIDCCHTGRYASVSGKDFHIACMTCSACFCNLVLDGPAAGLFEKVAAVSLPLSLVQQRLRPASSAKSCVITGDVLASGWKTVLQGRLHQAFCREVCFLCRSDCRGDPCSSSLCD